MTTDIKPETMPAFPLHNGDVWGGMALRDYFAAKAMQAYCMEQCDEGKIIRFDEIADDAYCMADAMLKARA